MTTPLNCPDRLEAALADARELIRLKPTDPDGYLCMGRVLCLLARFQEAAKVYRIGLQRIPHSRPLLLHLDSLQKASATNPFVQLPLEVMSIVVKFADQPTRGRLARLCRSGVCIRDIRIARPVKIPPSMAVHLQTVVCHGAPAANSLFKQALSLRHLVLDQIYDLDLFSAARVPRQFHSLERLDLCNSFCPDAVVSFFLFHCLALKELRLSNCPEITGTCLANSRCAALEVFSASAVPNLSPTHLNSFLGRHRLKRQVCLVDGVNLFGSPEALERLEMLETLGCTPVDIVRLLDRTYPSIQKLFIGGSRLRIHLNQLNAVLARFPSLRYLHIGDLTIQSAQPAPLLLPHPFIKHLHLTNITCDYPISLSVPHHTLSTLHVDSCPLEKTVASQTGLTEFVLHGSTSDTDLVACLIRAFSQQQLVLLGIALDGERAHQLRQASPASLLVTDSRVLYVLSPIFGYC